VNAFIYLKFIVCDLYTLIPRIYSLCRKLLLLLYAYTCPLYFLIFLLTMSVSYFGLYVPLLDSGCKSIQYYPCAQHEGK
jgi:hypothetical protein